MENQNNYPPSPYNPPRPYGYNQYPSPNQYPTPYSGAQPSYLPPPSTYPSYPHYENSYTISHSSYPNYLYPAPPPSTTSPPLPHHPTGYDSARYPYNAYPSPPPPTSTPPQPAFQNYGSFQYSSFHYHHQPSGELQPHNVQPDAPPRINSDYSTHYHHQQSGELQPHNVQSDAPPRISSDHSTHHHYQPSGELQPHNVQPDAPPRISSDHSTHYHHQPSGELQPHNVQPDSPPRISNDHSTHYHHQPSGKLHPPNVQTVAPPKKNSDHSTHHHYQGSSSTVGDSPSYPSLFPPIDDQLANVHLSGNQTKPSVPASPPAPSFDVVGHPKKYHSVSLPMTNNESWTAPSHHHSFSSWDTSSTGKWDSSPSISSAASYGSNMQLVKVSSSKTSLKVFLLHGNLEIEIQEAKNLPNMDMFHKTMGDMFNKFPGSMSNKIEGQLNRKNTTDPYISILIAGATLARTYVISNDENPVWMQKFTLPVAHNAAEVHFVVKDNDVVGSQYIGTVSIPVERIFEEREIQGFFPILNAGGKPCKAGAVLSLWIKYIPIEQLSIERNGVGAGSNFTGIPRTYFPLRRGGIVDLYQDAHVPDGCLPNMVLGNGMKYMHGKCWRDIFEMISQARRLIYITGWSVWHNVRLIRDENTLSDYTLGELLKSKSQEGVRVLLLVWDDPTSRSILGYKTDGVMQTHDEETRSFFKKSSVQVLLCPRVAGKRHSWIKQQEVGVIYTHHQKTVIVDADAGNNRRKIVAFLGGLDLCNGRYDTPDHHILRTLQTVHSDDYHNPTYVGNVVGCPREPWHDLHCKIDGPAAYDVLCNFEERWLKASKPHGIKKIKMSYDDALLRIERMPEILGISDSPCISDSDPEGWHVQVFRSIDSNSVKNFPKDPKDGTKKNLMCGKNVLIDMSIHTAYVEAIRAAQHFIYIENQYFIGSSYNWNQYKDTGANNLIPIEIALKIAAKIRAHERFAVYIVIPMWPEGNPTGAATQRILFWQHKTMQMMYETIYKALVEVGLEDAYSPQDYLNFYCLGNREALDSAAPPESQSVGNNPQGLSRKNRRFMIYVHSKGMIVDDEYVILGSANINQRSMEGSRDTEIAMGAYQPQHTWATRLSSPQGQIYIYRMSLWAEHLGFLEECFTQPESVECVRRVRSLGKANWEQFASPVVSEMKGHLLKYPVDIDRKGKVKPLPGNETFPDVGGNIVGSFLAIQENLTI